MIFAKAVGGLDEFKHRLLERLKTLSHASGYDQIVLPVALVLAIDKANGGDDTADEIQRRFFLLDAESRNVIDFYFLGWRRLDESNGSKGLAFDLHAFIAIRDALRAAGLKHFGGYADLVLLDARYDNGRVVLDFAHAMHLDLAKAVKAGEIVAVGTFLQGLIDAAGKLRESAATDAETSATMWISDELGLAVARTSLWHFILEKWGKIIGADKIAPLALRRIGPPIDLATFGAALRVPEILI